MKHSDQNESQCTESPGSVTPMLRFAKTDHRISPLFHPAEPEPDLQTSGRCQPAGRRIQLITVPIVPRLRHCRTISGARLGAFPGWWAGTRPGLGRDVTAMDWRAAAVISHEVGSPARPRIRHSVHGPGQVGVLQSVHGDRGPLPCCNPSAATASVINRSLHLVQPAWGCLRPTHQVA